MKNLTYSLLSLLPFLMIYLLSKTIFNNYYLFEWTASHLYLYTWLIAIVLILSKKYSYALMLSLANFFAVFIGQFVGDYLKQLNMAKITTTNDAETIAHLSNHHGFEIYLSLILITMIGFFIIDKKRPKNN